MDIIEEKYQKLIRHVKRMTLRKMMLLYVAVGLAAAFSGTFFIVRLTGIWKEMVESLEMPHRIEELESYLFIGEGMAIVLFVGFTLFLVCWLFYKNQMEAGLKNINQEISFLNKGDLSYDCEMNGDNEIALLCRSMNDMRKQLLANKKQTWELMEQQRLVNAAFAHDIRNPLTVMKGHIQMIRKFYPSGKLTEEKLMEGLETVSSQIERIEHFSQTMKNMSHMEEWRPDFRQISVNTLTAHLEHNLMGMAEGTDKQCLIKMGELQRNTFSCDLNMVQEVTDNLMTNALRYADTFVAVTVETTDEKLMIYVQDDGAGFSEKNLEKAGRPYFTTEKDHLGMGLAICKLLCKKHGGDLELINSIQKGGIVCAIFKFPEKVDKLLGI